MRFAGGAWASEARARPHAWWPCSTSRKDELAPEIGVTLENSAGGVPDRAGFDGSAGRPVAFDAAGPNITGLDWTAPADATGLRAVGDARAITLFWTAPAPAR